MRMATLMMELHWQWSSYICIMCISHFLGKRFPNVGAVVLWAVAVVFVFVAFLKKSMYVLLTVVALRGLHCRRDTVISIKIHRQYPHRARFWRLQKNTEKIICELSGEKFITSCIWSSDINIFPVIFFIISHSVTRVNQIYFVLQKRYIFLYFFTFNGTGERWILFLFYLLVSDGFVCKNFISFCAISSL